MGRIIIFPRGHGQIKRYPDFEPHPNIILLVIYIYCFLDPIVNQLLRCSEYPFNRGLLRLGSHITINGGCLLT
jgi:hypothetical protein